MHFPSVPARARWRRPASAALALLTLLCAAALPVLAAPAAHAADNGQWSVFPAGTPGGRAYFRLAAAPGATLRDKVTLRNLRATPVTFLLYAADGYNTPRDGGFAVRDQGERMTGVGRWTRLDHTTVRVAGHGQVTVPFTLRVPRDAQPGDHPGAVVAVDQRLSRSAREGVAVRQAVGSRVYLRVSGKRQPGLEVRGARFSYAAPWFPGGERTATVSYELVNSGNVMLSPRVGLRATGLFGRASFTPEPHRLPAELMPGQRVHVSERWSGPPFLDWGRVEVTASDSEGLLAQSTGVGYRTVSWGVLLLIAVLLAAVAGTWLVRRRSRRSAATRAPAS
ncbi:DUF916 domain-containing protein [Streptomyces sp. LP05-1]|uniref:DUF916 domain-containing protein n=1 Tax=Streptomyces pyxinae TaxID=2970734 RepID=A0ABT2CEA4_9ACTN|nr:DUF916 domain-containing protein [Streptomyces sp. LP05-1]MCS0635743.1 DUF916 domain-containing protein [Streptomyces sp. LP05-1]